MLTDGEANMLMDSLHAIRRAPTATLRAEAIRAHGELVYTFADWGASAQTSEDTK